MARSDKNGPEADDGDQTQGPVIRDNRRIDPETGEVRDPKAQEPGAEEPEVVEAEEGDIPEVPDTPEEVVSEAINADERVIELTNDIKRVQAEYANYRKRVERDRVAVREVATAQVLNELLPILDDIGRAREHEELTGGFKAVSESLETTATKLGLEKYGEKGDEFDPNVHEALTLVPAPNISVQTVIEVFQPGYRMGERVIRPARVVVGEPTDDAPEASEETSEESADSAGASAKDGENEK